MPSIKEVIKTAEGETTVELDNNATFKYNEAEVVVYQGGGLKVSGASVSVGGGSVAPTTFTTRSLVDGDDSGTFVCSTAQVATVNIGLLGGFGCTFKGAITFNGTSTISDLRTTGSANPWCSLVQIAPDTYDVLGTKA